MNSFDKVRLSIVARCCLVFLTLAGASAKAQQDTLWYGHVAFGEGRYDDAIAAYQAAIDQGSQWDWLPDLIQTVTVRKNLGAITPADTHKIAALFITERLEITNGDTVSSSDVTSTQKDRWRIYFGVLRQTLESFSNGSWTLKIDTVDARATYNVSTALPPDSPDHLALENFFFERMSEFDSFISFSNTRSPAYGLARRYPYLNGVLYGPHRGMAQINAGTHGYDVLLHEFFHVVEWASNAINPAHGYLPENRSNFPGWVGTTEFDYYRWHFANTLPGVGWNRLNHRTRWIPFENKRSGLDSLQSIYESVALEDRRTADTLVTAGIALKSTDSAAAVAKWEQALSLSPFHVEGLLELHDHYRFVAGDTAKTKELFDKLKLVRSVADFSTIDTANSSLGKVIGLWHREEIGRNTQFIATRVYRSWNISEHISQSGNYAASFYYTQGFKQLEMDSVSILEDGVQVSMDPHPGISGNVVMTDITYSLAVPDYKASSLYELRARIKGGGGVDSYGQIHLKYTGPLSSIEEGMGGPESFRLSQNYPNPFNPSTKIGFKLQASGFTSLKIFDLLGREVATLVNEQLRQGSYEVTWDGWGFPSGTYFYTLTSGTFTETKKLLLLK